MQKTLVSILLASMAAMNSPDALAYKGCKELAADLKSQSILNTFDSQASAKFVEYCQSYVAVWIGQCESACKSTYPEPVASSCKAHCRVGYQDLLWK